jgi:hypothetical protein
MSEYDVMSPKTKVALGCLALAFLLLLCSLVLSVKSVGATSVAVSERFGKVQGVRKPGVHFELFSNYTTYDTKIQKYESKQGAATNDLQDIDVSVTVVYRIDAEKALEIYKNIGDEKMIEEKALKPLVAQKFMKCRRELNSFWREIFSPNVQRSQLRSGLHGQQFPSNIISRSSNNR